MFPEPHFRLIRLFAGLKFYIIVKKILQKLLRFIVDYVFCHICVLFVNNIYFSGRRIFALYFILFYLIFSFAYTYNYVKHFCGNERNWHRDFDVMVKEIHLDIFTLL
jgi:hypothetical protein